MSAEVTHAAECHACDDHGTTVFSMHGGPACEVFCNCARGRRLHEAWRAAQGLPALEARK